jgi:hypothetical protein
MSKATGRSNRTSSGEAEQRATGMIFEYALERSGPEEALNNVSAVLSDVAGRFGRDPGNWYLGYQAFGQSGFRSAFGETPPGNQVRHFTAHVLLGYYWGNGAAARSFVAWREGGFRGPDYASGVAGLNLGVGLRSGAVTGSKIFDVVQDYLRCALALYSLHRLGGAASASTKLSDWVDGAIGRSVARCDSTVATGERPSRGWLPTTRPELASFDDAERSSLCG